MSKPLRLGDLLIEKGLIEDKHLHYALQVQKVTKEKLGQVLTRVGLVSEYDLVKTVAEQLGLEYMDLSREQPDPAILKRFNRNVCLNQYFFPLRQEGNHILIATSDLPNQNIEQSCLRFTGKRPRFVLAEETQVVTSIYNYFYFLENPVESIIQREAEVLAADTRMTVSPDSFIQHLLLLAVKRRTTDIHIRPMSNGISVAFRVDGVLRNEYFFPVQLKRIITAIKLQAGMDISEQRLPQDGRWTARILNRSYDIRASSVVTPYGENIVLRLLSQERASFSLESLGFLPEDLSLIQQAFAEPFGIVLLTGPTGSGKSTTLVAGLMTLDLLGKNVLTIEDPIEYVVPLARQTQVNEAAGYDFANAMRYFLRHDPDVILVGEMRDELTTKTAMTAANTGHLVLSTLHTNTALGAIARLQNLNVDNLTIAESLVCVVSQRLVRTVCKHCRQPYVPSAEEKAYLKEDVDQLYRGAGCDSCAQSGYLGRTLVYEILLLDSELRSLLERGVPIYELAQTIKQKGFKSMFDIGVAKIKAGLTTLEEIKRVLGTTRY
ncbi:type II/IV secretion system protein [Desulfohalobiaceae bacterium Ax17]|jgi:general secretion pathway protein E/type IV pilus assembly protein PilB|uniref:GspE/PulE family protein n=1 Tax=Desulfovulcanus ferrireducens TaxID=2831190 RepID=UPI00207BA867|nr:GspE/PulE family protein [Desulfovulcanus ferrireducens]MBT8764149.1 type II/IV secretion system protein [Desulfovulcanus ferrireducens]